VRFEGFTSAVEDGTAWAVRFRIEVDEEWCTRAAYIRGWSDHGERELRAESDGAGHWRINGTAVEELDGCLDIDLEASACTNTLPVHRLAMPVGEVVVASAVYVQAADLVVRRLDQTYRRLDDHRFAYTSEGGFEAVLIYDDSLLVVDYPGIATRFA
jgi:hypothetical protein